MGGSLHAAASLSDIAKTSSATDSALRVHASCVAYAGRAVLICGPAGSGKSSLALELMALGCTFVSDDQTELVRTATGHIEAKAPDTIRGMIEARGIGLLNAEAAECGIVVVVVDLGQTTSERLPSRAFVTVLGISLRLLHKAEITSFAPAILQYLKAGERPLG